MERGGEPVLKRFSRSDGETAFFSCSERQGVGLALFPQEECFWNLEADQLDQPVTSEEKPDIQEACKQERPRSGFLKPCMPTAAADGMSTTFILCATTKP